MSLGQVSITLVVLVVPLIKSLCLSTIPPVFITPFFVTSFSNLFLFKAALDAFLT